MIVARALVALVALVASACVPHATTNAVRPDQIGKSGPTCHYDVTVARAIATLDVVARCDGDVRGFTAEPALSPYTTDVRDEHGVALTQDGTEWSLPSHSASAVIRYRVDLDGAARELRDFDTALAYTHSLVAPLSSYALAPDPLPATGSATVTVHSLPGNDFVTELASTPDGHGLALYELSDSTYGVFGKFQHDIVALPGVRGPASIDVVSLDDGFALSREERAAWIRRDAEAVARYYGAFPVDRAGVLLAPVPGRKVAFGKVLPAGGATIALLLGTDIAPSALNDDWVLVHEMFHLGFPSFSHEGRWLDEGLATYVEPLIRARAGMLTEEQGWAEVIRDMPRGVRLCEGAGLENFGRDYRAVYWGGAVLSLLADVEARKRTNDRIGLEQALRAVLAKGYDATHVLRLADAISLVDTAFGSPILASLAGAYADHGSPLSLDPILTELGVERRGDLVRLHDDAPLAGIRRSIMYGPRAPGHG